MTPGRTGSPEFSESMAMEALIFLLRALCARPAESPGRASEGAQDQNGGFRSDGQPCLWLMMVAYHRIVRLLILGALNLPASSGDGFDLSGDGFVTMTNFPRSNTVLDLEATQCLSFPDG